MALKKGSNLNLCDEIITVGCKDRISSDQCNFKEDVIIQKTVPMQSVCTGEKHASILRSFFFHVHLDTPKWQTTSTGNHYFTFAITIQTNDPAFSLSYSSTSRRYSEFCWLRKALRSNDIYNTQLPSLPTRGLFRDRLDPEFLEERRNGLENFLRQVVETPVFKADKALHLFVQTSLCVNDIDLNVRGLRHDDVINRSRETASTSNSDLVPDSGGAVAIPATGRHLMPTSFNGSTGSEFDPRSLSLRASTKWPSPKRVTFCDEVKAVAFSNSSPSNIHC